MKTVFSKLLVAILTITPVFLVLTPPTPVLAKVISSEQTVTIAQDKTIDEDLFIGGSVVSVDGTVNGNLFVVGGQISLRGTVHGSVFAVGGSLDVSNATITDNLVVGAGNINVTATEIGNGLITGTGNLSVDSNSKIGGGLVVGAGSLTLNAPVGKEVLAGAGSAVINSQVEKDVQINAEQLTLGQSANLKGSLTYTSSKDASIHQEAKIAGKVTKKAPHAPETAQLPGRVAGLAKQISLGFKFFSYLSSLLIGLIILYLFPKDAQKVAGNLLERPWHSLGMGFLALVLTIPAAILLMFSLIGFPLAFLTLVSWGIALYLTKIFVGLLFGRSLLETLGRSNSNVYLSLVVGLAVYQILTLVPFLGWFVSLATMTFGLGALILCGHDYVRQGRTSPALHTEPKP